MFYYIECTGIRQYGVSFLTFYSIQSCTDWANAVRTARRPPVQVTFMRGNRSLTGSQAAAGALRLPYRAGGKRLTIRHRAPRTARRFYISICRHGLLCLSRCHKNPGATLGFFVCSQSTGKRLQPSPMVPYTQIRRELPKQAVCFISQQTTFRHTLQHTHIWLQCNTVVCVSTCFCQWQEQRDAPRR